MSCKLLDKCREAEREIIDETQGNRIELEYYLLTSEMDDCEKEAMITTYGVEIVKKVDGKSSETKRFKNVHTDKEKMVSIIGMLAENTVTPVSLQDILEDLL